MDQDVPAELEPFEARTVALLNRGVPSFAVDTAGALHTALLRSCTGWPSAVWIDQPRRTAPDGIAFQLQHWTHTFDYALVAGDGDWRQARDPGAQRRVRRPAAGRPGDRRAPARCRASGSLLRVDPADGVGLGALKAAGNPLARGSAAARRPRTP